MCEYYVSERVVSICECERVCVSIYACERAV